MKSRREALNPGAQLPRLTRLQLAAMLSGVSPTSAEVGQMDEDSQALMRMQFHLPGFPQTAVMMKEQYRRVRAVTQPDLPQVDRVREYEALGPYGPVPIRVYRGAGTADCTTLPVLVYYHGGGWTVGDLDSHDWICRSIANAAQCAVVNVDYHLAPEHVFPAAFDDARAALRWVIVNADMLRVDPERVAIGGDGAGGNLAAAVAIAERDTGQARLRAQILIYPAVDLSLSGPYYGRFTTDVLLTEGMLRRFVGLYVPNPVDRKDWRASPLLADSLKGLPPALVLLAGFDPLGAQGESYAKRLESDGVRTTVKRYAGQMHEFMSHAKLLPKANEAVADVAEVLRANRQ